MTKAELEKKVLEIESRLLAMITGNITLMAKIEQLEKSISNLLWEVHTDVKNQLDNFLSNDEINKKRLLNLEMQIDYIKTTFNEFFVKLQCNKKDLVKTEDYESNLPF